MVANNALLLSRLGYGFSTSQRSPPQVAVSACVDVCACVCGGAWVSSSACAWALTSGGRVELGDSGEANATAPKPLRVVDVEDGFKVNQEGKQAASSQQGQQQCTRLTRIVDSILVVD